MPPVEESAAEKSLVESFPPIAAPDARVLILGSMPGVASLEAGEYYAHPRNAFWPIMGRLFGAGPELRYEERCRVLEENQIAVWDVLRQCVRPGSLDSRIDPASERPNDIPGLLERCPKIRLVAFNGQKAEQAFRRHVQNMVASETLEFVRLPSTSPAHASRSLEEKTAAWRQVLLRGPS